MSSNSKRLYTVSKKHPNLGMIDLRPFSLITMGLVDYTLFTKKRNSHIIIVQIYVDDIIFGLTYQELYDDFSKIMHDEFEMSMMCELNSTEGIFLGYSPNSKAYVILNKETMRVEESLNVKFNESPPPKSPPLVDDDFLENNVIEKQDKDLEIK
ncbi:hypothetical protein Tco_0812226 [Tanacetum coccineum]